MSDQPRPLPSQPDQSPTHALDQVRWVIDRFAGADQPDWAAPDEDELLEHFTEHFLTVIPAERIVTTLSSQAALFQAPFDRAHREGRIVLAPRQPLFLHRPDRDAVHQQGRGAVVVVRGNPQDLHVSTDA